MLSRLLVRNFLLVAEVELDLSVGLNVLTGETGTGKSIILDALALVLGRRGGQDLVGPESDELLVEAVFHSDQRLSSQLHHLGVTAGGKEIILCRRVKAQGEGRCFINGQRVLLRQLKKLGSQLVEIHGQREEERFRSSEVQRNLLDLFGNQTRRRKQIREQYNKLIEAQNLLTSHQAHLSELSREQEWITFQLREIDDLAPEADELEQLRQRVKDSRHDQDILEWLALAEQILNGPEGGLLEYVETLADRTSQLPGTPDWSETRHSIEQLRSISFQLYRDLQNRRQDVDSELSSLPILEKRLGALEALQRKHRKTIPEIIETATQMRRSLDELESATADVDSLRLSVNIQADKYHKLATALSSGRKRASVSLSKALESEVALLGMKNFRLKIVFESLAAGDKQIKLDSADDGDVAAFGPSGQERVLFLAQTNPGSEFRPLGEIASGGEMARVALALRVVMGEKGRSLLTVFDEIDAGLGATAAKAVASRLTQVANHRQVLLVTHLPVIAAAASHHFRIGKNRLGDRNLSSVTILSRSERVGEIARMLGGDASNKQARQHAAALLSP